MNSRSKGFTLVELLVVMTIGTIVMTAVVQVMATQERVNRQQMAIVGTEQNARMALGVIEADLREVSATDGDIYYADSISIRFRALRKAGIICTKDYGTNTYVKAAVWGQPFAVDDSVLVFLEGANKSAASDDTWGVTRVTAVSASTCTGNPIGNVQQITMPSTTVVNADSGGLMRSFVPVGFRIVTSSNSGVLYRMEGTDSVAVVEGLGTAGASAGLRLRYFNAAGTQITPTTAALRATIMRIQVKVAARQAGGQTGNNRQYADSLIGMVFLRGNRKTT